MRLIITNTDTQEKTILKADDLAEHIRSLQKQEQMNRRADATLYIWHGKLAPSPVLELRDIHGKKGRMML